MAAEEYDVTEGYYLDPEVIFARAGERDDFHGGPATLTGFYIVPFCDAGCCRPWGPFTSEAEAVQWCRMYIADDRNKYTPPAKYGPLPRG